MRPTETSGKILRSSDLGRRGRDAFLALTLGLASSGCLVPASATPVRPVTTGETTFEYTPPASAPPVTSITVRGTFNDWAEHALPMERQPNGSWRATVRLEPGAWEYKFFINRSWPTDMCRDATWGDPQRDFRIDPAAEHCVADGHSGRNAVITVAGSPPGDGPGFVHDPSAARYVSVAGDRLSVRFAVDRDRLRSARLITGSTSVAMHRQFGHGTRETWRATLPSGTTAWEIAIEDGAGSRRLGPFTAPGTPFRDVPWVGSAVGYQIFPERFWNGDPTNDSLALATSAHRYTHPGQWNAPPPALMPDWDGPVMDFHCCHQYFGGDLQGIIDRLDHLETLGVTLLYLNPVFVAGSAHGYDTHDHLRVSPAFGGERALTALLDATRRRGMRVMWDFVPNHVGVGHWAFQHAVRNGEASPYWNWFRFHVPAPEVEVGNAAHYDAWWGFGSLPELETRNPEVLEYLMSVARHWTGLGLDGVRVDVPGDIRNRAQFFPALRRTIKAADPDVYLVGEVWSRSAGWLRGEEFDALMNYAIGRDVIQRFAAGEMPGHAAADAMAQLYAEYPEASVAMQFNLISSHDTPRILTSMGGGELGDTPGRIPLARQRLAAAILYALPGMPVTFQGDECAFLGGGPPREENRYPLQWQACDRTMVAHYSELARWRSELRALRSPAIRSIGGEGSLLWFHRGEPGEGEVLAVFNAGGELRSLALPEGEWQDATGGQRVADTVTIAGLEWRHLRRR